MVSRLNKRIALLLVAIMAMLPLYNLQAASMMHAPMPTGSDQLMEAHSGACPMHDSDTDSAANADTLCGGMGCELCGVCTITTLSATSLLSDTTAISPTVSMVEQLPQPLLTLPFRPPRV